MIKIAFWVTLVAALLSCYFAACTLASKRFNRARLAELLERRGQGHRLDFLVDRADDILLVSGLLRSAANMIVIFGALFWVHAVVGGRPTVGLRDYALAFVVAGALMGILGVAVPGSLTRYRAEAVLARSSGFLVVALGVLQPAIRLLHALDPLVRRLSGVAEQPDENAISQEVLSVVEEHEDQGAVDPAQRQMIQAVFELPTTTAGAIMTPRTEVQGLPVGATLGQVKEAILHAGHSRIPVYEQTIDNIVGIVFAKDLIRYLGETGPFELRKVLREPLMVPESKPVRELLAEFKTRKVHMAVVLDEYGGTAGVVTIEDIMEELVGEIRDEYDVTHDEPNIRRLDARTVDVDARVRIDDLTQEMALTLPDAPDYDTVGGFVFSTLGHIPVTGEQFDHGSLRFTVTDAGRTRVNRVKVEQIEGGNGAEGR